MGLLEDFNKSLEDAQTALQEALTKHGETLGAAFQSYFDSCRTEHETFKTRLKEINATFNTALHGGAAPEVTTSPKDQILNYALSEMERRIHEQVKAIPQPKEPKEPKESKERNDLLDAISHLKTEPKS